MEESTEPPTLGAQNRDIIESFLSPFPSDLRDGIANQLQNEYESTVRPEPPVPGHQAPDFALRDQHGIPLALKDITKPVVLSFYRGGWCNFCATALRALQRRLPAIEAKNGVVWGISPEPPDAAKQTARENRLGFPLLHDQDNQVADLYGLRWSFAPMLLPLYAQHGIDAPEHTRELDVPFPATIIIDADHTVVQTFMDQDPSVRMEPSDIAAVLTRLNDNAQPD